MNDKELRIINAATKLFFSNGPRKTTIEDISKEADLGKGTVYLYFQSKEEIFSTVIKRETLALLQKIRWTIELESRAADKLKAFLMTKFRHFETMVKNFGTTLEIIRETRQQPEIEQIFEEQIREETKIIECILQFGIEKGEFTVESVELTSFAISLSTQGDMPWNFEGQKLDIETKVNILTNLFINGLRKQ